jgi:curved DNA-binding protein CbpA
MSSSRSGGNKKGFPEKDPYEVLGLAFGASEADISKAYRQLARTLHPDKIGTQNLTASDIEKATARFHDIQLARNFLLDPEHAEDKRQYDAKRASEMVRREAERNREQQMSERRKRMRDELRRQEELQKKQKLVKGDRTTGDSKENLARQGIKLREEYAARKAAAAEAAETSKSNQQSDSRNIKEKYQVRLKWSRKKLKENNLPSPSEDSIARMMGKFGTVNHVMFIGSKGNLALVTFEDPDACDKAVQDYSESEIWRATYVEKGKRDEYQKQKVPIPTAPTLHLSRDGESVNDWKLRRDAEREKLLHQMESKMSNTVITSSRPYPPDFPEEFDVVESPIDKLELAEERILRNILPMEVIQGIKVYRK